MIFLSFYLLALLATTELETISNNLIIVEDIINQEITSEEISLSTTKLTTDRTILPITISNKIDPEMLRYKHWTGTYAPEIFTVYINDTIVPLNETYTLSTPKDPFVVRFDYSFMNGLRTGTKTCSYSMKEQSTHATITFSWLDPNKIIIDNATLNKDN